MEYLAFFVLAALSHTGSARSWRGHNHGYPEGNHHNFNYNNWCHSAGGWDSHWDRHKDSWEGSSSEESHLWDDRNRWTRPTTTTRRTVITTTQSQGTTGISIRAATDTPSPFELLSCLRGCTITPEYNPVCGTDDITYWNPGRLQCAISCGVDVVLKRPSICPTSNFQSTTSTSSSINTLSPQVLATCMRNCPVTSEYNPICGTDNITYNNPSRLECAKNCGKPVSQRLSSRCPPPDQITASITSSSTSSSSSTTTTTTARPNSTNGPNSGSRTSTDYTISPDLLAAIFNKDNSTRTTTEYIPDFSLDERHEDFIDSIV